VDATAEVLRLTGGRGVDLAFEAAAAPETPEQAAEMLRPGGKLITCSCSFHVSESDFLDMLAAAAADAHRPVRLLEVRRQSPDHPVLLNVPETQYLKCVICEAL
jgi:23S rRNA G2069 N7-methylase RlmK/C1962 C5-methylase RlmI